MVFVDQASELVDMALDKYHSLSDDQREELATYIIPEVSGLLISTSLVLLLCVFLPPPLLSPSLSPSSLSPSSLSLSSLPHC